MGELKRYDPLRLLVNYLKIDGDIEIYRDRARSVVIIGLLGFGLFTISQAYSFFFHGDPLVLNFQAVVISVGLNIVTIVSLAIFYLLNFVLVENFGWDRKNVYQVSIILLFVVLLITTIAHIHLAGSASSLLPLLIVVYTLINAWLLGLRQGWGFFIIATLLWISLFLLTKAGLLTYMPLSAQNDRIPLDVFLEWKYLGINIGLFVFISCFMLATQVYLQRQIYRQNEELERQRRLLENNYDQLRELEQLRDSLTHMIVHDLRSPLAGVKLNIEVVGRALKKDPDLSEHEKNMDRALVGLSNVLEQINCLLDVHKMESGKMEINSDRISLARMVEDATESLGALATKQKIDILIDEDLPNTSCDPSLIQRVIANLLSNALRFSPEDEKISIHGSKSGNMIRVEVEDSGPGVPEEFQEKIFEKFGQAEIRSQKKMLTTGLGLTFCKLTVETHGGQIGVDSSHGKGSRFWFTLPIYS